jgi:oligopeptide/dipeptide ABC transporter ATP-binding protein
MTRPAIGSTMPPLLEAEALRVVFRTMGRARALLSGVRRPFIDAVLDVDLALQPGRTLGLVGESGSGKTSLGRALLGLVPVAGGSIRFDGAPVPRGSDRAWRPLRRRAAMMFQDPVGSLSPRLTVRSLVTEPFRIHRVAVPSLAAEAERLLGLVGLPPVMAHRYPHELSGGQARRIGVARALALSPRLVIADEPTAGLDVSVQGEILNLMGRLQRELGLSYIVITHNLPVVRHISDELAIMYLGRFVEQGPTAAIFAAPAHPYSHGLLAAVPAPDPDRRRDDVELQGEVPSLARRPPGCEFHTRCPQAQPRCRAEPPAWRELLPGRRVRCHFPLVGPQV